MSINYRDKTIEVKIVYCGLAESGKDISLAQLYQLVPAADKSALGYLQTSPERVGFFKFNGTHRINSFRLKYNIKSLPSASYYEDTKSGILQGADALIVNLSARPAEFDETLKYVSELKTFVAHPKIIEDDLIWHYQINAENQFDDLSEIRAKYTAVLQMPESLVSEVYLNSAQSVAESFKKTVSVIVSQMKERCFAV